MLQQGHLALFIYIFGTDTEQSGARPNQCSYASPYWITGQITSRNQVKLDRQKPLSHNI